MPYTSGNMNTNGTGNRVPRHAASNYRSVNQNQAGRMGQGGVPQGYVPQNQQGRASQNPAGQRQAPQNYVSQSRIPQGGVYRTQAPQNLAPQGQFPQGQTPQRQMPQDQFSQGQMPQGKTPNGKNPKPKKKLTPSAVIFRIAAAVFVVSLLALGAIGLQYWWQDKEYSEMQSYVQVSDKKAITLDDLTVDWAALQEINPDVVGWIYVPDTKINYPIVQGKNNEEYLHKAFNKDEGWLASAGTIFLDVKNQADFTDRNSALYGHHMNDGSMFACLTDWADSETFNQHRTIYLLTPRGNYLLTTFAVVKSTGSDPIVETTFANREAYVAYIQDKLNRSIVKQKGNVLSADDIYQSLLLSTCEYTQEDGRMIVYASVTESTVKSAVYLLESHQNSEESPSEGLTGLDSSQVEEVGQLN